MYILYFIFLLFFYFALQLLHNNCNLIGWKSNSEFSFDLSPLISLNIISNKIKYSTGYILILSAFFLNEWVSIQPPVCNLVVIVVVMGVLYYHRYHGDYHGRSVLRHMVVLLDQLWEDERVVSTHRLSHWATFKNLLHRRVYSEHILTPWGYLKCVNKTAAAYD